MSYYHTYQRLCKAVIEEYEHQKSIIKRMGLNKEPKLIWTKPKILRTAKVVADIGGGISNNTYKFLDGCIKRNLMESIEEGDYVGIKHAQLFISPKFLMIFFLDHIIFGSLSIDISLRFSFKYPYSSITALNRSA